MGLRVLHIGKFFPPFYGGMEVFLADLIAEQHCQGIDAFALVHGTPLPEDPAWLIRVQVQCQLVYAPIALGFRAALAKAIQDVKPDVLHLHMPNNSAFWCLTLESTKEIPWVVHWHADVVASEIRTTLALAYQLYRPFEQAVLHRAIRIIATSPPYLAASEPLQMWQDKCAIVPLGLAQLAVTDRLSVNQPGWNSNGCLRVLSIGRLSYYKGFDTLIRAVSESADVQLLIAGDGECRAELAAIIAELRTAGRPANITLLGAVSDSEKHALLASCDVFCLASNERTEAFGVVVLEAMQHARPCLVSDLAGSGLQWLVKTSGAGLLCAVGSTASWRAQIERLRQAPDLCRSLGLAGKRAMNERFSIAPICSAITTEYELVTGTTQAQLEMGRPLIVIPARNEAETIGILIADLRAAGWRDVLVVDDSSNDSTGEIAQNAGARVLRPVLPLGAWGAMQTGIRHGLEMGYGSVITMDADGQHEVEQLPVLLAAAAQGDVVIGAFPERASRLRQFAWAWFRRLTGFELRDLTSGFRHYNQSAMRIAASSSSVLLDYQDLGTLLLIRRAGLTICETPVTMQLRSNGKSRIFSSWLSVARYMFATTLICLTLR